MIVALDSVRACRPADPDHLWHWVAAYTGVRVSRARVCRGHAPPFDWFASQWFDRPPLVLILGARGSGKSFLQAVLTHLESRFTPGLGTRILGGSKAQSLQIYDALSRTVLDGRGALGSDGASLRKLLKTEAVYRNGSNVSILAASPTAVRGPHVASLRLDEVDEIEPDIRESAMGMAMAVRGVPATVSFTSTWHRVGGPMSSLMGRASNGELPSYTTCAFDVLERCPASRSGPYVGGASAYERCPDCPIVRWCHAERDSNGGVPLAKRSAGHYAIESLIQKVRGVSARVFESDYLCRGPKADGVWFTRFSERNVSEDAEYDPRRPVHLSVDSGVWTGAVAFQVGAHGRVSVFDEFLAEGRTAESCGLALRALVAGRSGTRLRVSTDPAGGARNPVGPTVLAEYLRVGLVGSNRDVDRWPHGSVADGLALVESLVCAADDSVSLLIHPRCKRLIEAMRSYRRAKRAGQFMDWPEDPQHPHEELVDSLRGGLRLEFPDGRRPPIAGTKTPLSHVRY